MMKFICANTFFEFFLVCLIHIRSLAAHLATHALSTRIVSICLLTSHYPGISALLFHALVLPSRPHSFSDFCWSTAQVAVPPLFCLILPSGSLFWSQWRRVVPRSWEPEIAAIVIHRPLQPNVVPKRSVLSPCSCGSHLSSIDEGNLGLEEDVAGASETWLAYHGPPTGRCFFNVHQVLAISVLMV